MTSPSSFEILKPADSGDSSQRTGVLRLQKGTGIATPGLLALSSRGFVPHLTPDTLQTTTSIQVIHAGYEDYAETTPDTPVHFSVPCPPAESPLKRYISLPGSYPLVLGPRRGKPVHSNGANTYTSLNICTASGHRSLEITAYLEAIANSRPDAIIAAVDVEFGRQPPGVRRRDKLVERSTAWLRSFENTMSLSKAKNDFVPAAWIPILPVEAEIQRTYLQHLEDMDPYFVNGIVIYDSASATIVPRTFQDRPLVSLTDPATPHDILKLVALGVDLIAAPFINAASEAGVCFDFEFPPKRSNSRKALGSDMWSEEHATDLESLATGCECYACQNHHKAYVRHLLSVKEMLAWTLLQIHNHHIMDNFFAGIRQSIDDSTFDTAAQEFYAAYESEFPVFHGQGPRIRGYQTSLGRTPKKLNQPSFKKYRQSDDVNTNTVLNDNEEKILESQEAEGLGSGMDAESLENLGFAELYGQDVNQQVEPVRPANDP